MNDKQKKRASSESAAYLFVVGGILVLLNVLGLFAHGRVDATDRKLFSLSSGSKRLVSNLKDRMEVIAYFSDELPAPHNATERYVRDLLKEYRDVSGGKLSIRFVHPRTDEEKQAAEADGVLRVQDQTYENDTFNAKEGYRGLAVHYLGDKRAIGSIDSTDGLEYELTQLIKEMTGEKVKIGVLAGHNAEPQQNPMQMMQQPPSGTHLNAIKSYLPTYDVQEIKADKEIPSDLRALLIVQPETPITEPELRYIDQFVMNGGSLAVFGGGVKVEANQGIPSASALDSGLNKLLEKWGVKIGEGVVADAQCSRAQMEVNPGVRMRVMVPYPPVPILTFADYQRKHPVLFKMDQLAMPFASPITFNDKLKADKDVKRVILAQSTKQSWLMQGGSIDLKSRERWEIPGYNGPYAVAAAIEGKLPSAFAGSESPDIKAPARAVKPVHVLVFGSGFFMRDEFLPPQQAGERGVPGGAVALSLNAIDWLAQDSDMIEIRAKSVEDPALEVPTNVKEAEATIREAVKEQDESKAQSALEERKAAMATWNQKKSGYRWGNMLGLPLAFALFGVVRWRIRKARRADMKL